MIHMLVLVEFGRTAKGPAWRIRSSRGVLSHAAARAQVAPRRNPKHLGEPLSTATSRDSRSCFVSLICAWKSVSRQRWEALTNL